MKKGKIGNRAPGTPVCKQAGIGGDMRRNFVIRFLFAQRFCTVVLLCFCGVHLQAAGATGLSGSLTDPQGQVIPDATIRIWRRADSTRWETKTDAQGQFSFNRLDGGEYRLTADSPGFAVLSRTIAVPVGRLKIYGSPILHRRMNPSSSPRRYRMWVSLSQIRRSGS